MTASERLRSCRGPSWLAYHGDLWSSRWSKPQKLHRSPFEGQLRACSDIFSDALSGRPHQSQQLSYTALSSRATFIFLWIRLLFIHKTHALSRLFSNRHVKKLAYFMSFNSAGFHFTFHFQILHYRLKTVGQKCLIRPAELLQFVNYCRLWTLIVWHQNFPKTKQNKRGMTKSIAELAKLLKFILIMTSMVEHFSLEYMIVNIWKSYMWNAVEETNIEAIFPVMNTTEVVRGSLLFSSCLQPQCAYMIFIYL